MNPEVLRRIPLGLALACALFSTRSYADDALVPAYRENFISETVFPTSPELDGFGLGGLQVVAFAHPDTSVTLNGAAAHLSLLATLPGPILERTGVALNTSAVGDRMVLSATFDDYVIVLSDDGVQGFFVLANLPGGELAYGLSMANGAANIVATINGTPLGSVPLPQAQRDAIVFGASYRVSLDYIASQASISGQIEVEGFAPTPGPGGVQALGSPGGSIAAFALFIPLTMGQQLDVNLRSFEIDALPPAAPVPAMGTIARGLLIAFLMATGSIAAAAASRGDPRAT